MTKHDDWQSRAARWFCYALGAVAIYGVFRFAASVLIVFGIALGVGAVVYPLSVRTARRLHWPQRLCAVVYVLAFLLLLGGALAIGVSRIAGEVQELLVRWESGEDGIAGAITRIWDALTDRLSRLPVIGSFVGMIGSSDAEHTVSRVLSNLLRDALSQIGTACSAATLRVLRATPHFFIALIVGVMACFYLGADYCLLWDKLLSRLSPSVCSRIGMLRTRAGHAVRRYLRAYLLLFGLTFLEVLIGLWILKQPYALLIALGVAAVDVLPVLGAGAVLIPWALVSLLFGNYHMGLGLLILYGAVTLIRQIVEPHVVGSSLGLHPFISLFFVFVGWELFGIMGMLVAPFAALLLRELWRAPSAREE